MDGEIGRHRSHCGREGLGDGGSAKDAAGAGGVPEWAGVGEDILTVSVEINE